LPIVDNNAYVSLVLIELVAFGCDLFTHNEAS